jgi:hypothetical protein
MKYLYSLLTRTGLATMENDAKSCYDHISCGFVMIVSQYFGISLTTASTQAQTLLKMHHCLLTALGASMVLKHTQATHIHGIGQGSFASPSIYCF